MASLLCQLGTYHPLTDAWTLYQDLNDGQVFEIEQPRGLDLPPPGVNAFVATNPRQHGLRVTHTTYGERTIAVTLMSGPNATYAGLLAGIRALIAAQELVRAYRLQAQLGLGSAPRLALLLQPPGSVTPVYADVLVMEHDVPDAGDVQSWVRLLQEGMELVFVCAPYLRSPRVTLANDCPNPGFEAPGGVSPGAVPTNVFRDPLANGQAYTATGVTYASLVLGDGPNDYYRLDEASGATAQDSSGNGHNGTITGTPTYQVSPGAIVGDTDTAMGFSNTQSIVVPTAGIPTGNNPFSVELWFLITATPSGFPCLFGMGVAGTRTHWSIYLNNAGKLYLETGGGQVGYPTPSLNAWHHVVGTWDGTTMTMWLDGVASTGTPGAMNLSYGAVQIGMDYNGANHFTGTLDEVAVYAVCLTADQVAAHSALGHGTQRVGVSALKTLAVPASAQALFGSPAWGPLAQWQFRFQYPTAGAFNAIFHWTNAQNYLYLLIDGGQMALHHVAGGADFAIASTVATLTGTHWYWVQVTSFPAALPNYAPQVAASLFLDNAGVIDAVVANLGPKPVHDGTTALSGTCGWAVNSVGALHIGGNFANVQQVALFGPGGWGFTSSQGTAPGSGAWDSVHGYAGGAVASAYAGRIDMPPAGTCQAEWQSCPSGSGVGGSQVRGVALTPGQTVYVAMWAQSQGLSANAQIRLETQELDASGNYLRNGAYVQMNGNQAAWVQLLGNWVVGANAAYANIICRVNDQAVPGESANGWVLFDNVQCWPGTLGATMPYCELRFPNAPGQVVLTGLVGDVPAPAMLAVGILPNAGSMAAGGSLALYAGRRSVATFAGRFVGSTTLGLPNDGSSTLFASDPGTYGGYRTEFRTLSSSFAPFAVSDQTANLLGVYHLFLRSRILDVSATTMNLQAIVYQVLSSWVGNVGKTDRLGLYQSPFTFPWSANNVWTLTDAGQVAIPPAPMAPMTDPTQIMTTAIAQDTSSSTGLDADWWALLPVDGECLAASWLNNTTGVTLSGWVWGYLDGLSHQATGQSTTTWSLEAAAAPNIAHAGGGPGALTQNAPAINPVGDSVPLVDPTLSTLGGQGINQWVIIATDNQANPLAMACRVVYAPLWLMVR